MPVAVTRRVVRDVSQVDDDGAHDAPVAYYPDRPSEFRFESHLVAGDHLQVEHIRTTGPMTTECETTTRSLIAVAGEGVAGSSVGGVPIPTSTISLAPAGIFCGRKERDSDYAIVSASETFIDLHVPTVTDLEPRPHELARVTRLLAQLRHLADTEGTTETMLAAAMGSIADALHVVIDHARRSVGTVERSVADEVVAAAVTAIRDRQATSITDLIEHVAASRSSLYRSFDAVMGISPYAFMQRRRLTILRRRLLEVDDEPGAVTREAANLGAYHLGNLAHSYRELFGELPSETAKRGPSSLPMDDWIVTT